MVCDVIPAPAAPAGRGDPTKSGPIELVVVDGLVVLVDGLVVDDRTVEVVVVVPLVGEAPWFT